jgi:hypothetical protein
VRFGVLVTVVFAVLGFSQSSAVAALPDASCPGPSDMDLHVGPNQRESQTFTALRTGWVIRAQTEILNFGSGGDFTMQILDTDAAGVPVDGVLGAATVPDAAVPSGPSTLAATLTSPAPVVAGHTYALVVTRPSFFDIEDRGGNPCPGGEYESPDQTSPFVALNACCDWVFQVFVNPDNRFAIGPLKARNLTVTVPGPGTIVVADASAVQAPRAGTAASRKALKTSTVSATAAGDDVVTLRLTKKAKRRLKSAGKLKARAAVTFTPTDGDPSTQMTKLKFKKKG